MSPDHYHIIIHSKSWRPWRPVSANFFHFPPKFRLRENAKTIKTTLTNASPFVCRLCFVFNINTSYINLFYFENLLLKNPDLCNLSTFVAIFCRNLRTFPANFWRQKKEKQTPPNYPLLECMGHQTFCFLCPTTMNIRTFFTKCVIS